MIIEQGDAGFGVGVCPEEKLPVGFTPMEGCYSVSSANYGNYITSNGSQMVFIPAFYYRIGNVNSPRYNKLKLNCIDILNYNLYQNLAESYGFTLHRAFIDGGKKRKGFFIDKYICSKENDTIVSLPNKEPISLSSNEDQFSCSSSFKECKGVTGDVFKLVKLRGDNYHCASIFQYTSLALLSKAQGQAARSTKHCAWYNKNALYNRPKGCNYMLSDIFDNSVKYREASHYKPLTGAYKGFNKTTHNGQANGVADLNGSMLQSLVGVTCYDGKMLVLKESASVNNINKEDYDVIEGLVPENGYNTTFFVNDGDDSYQLFSSDNKGLNYYRTSIGLPNEKNTNNDYPKEHSGLIDVLALLDGALVFGSGHWNSENESDILFRDFTVTKNYDYDYYGFRCALYV